jgi:hypothetical protein
MVTRARRVGSGSTSSVSRLTTRSGCNAAYARTIDIWVNGVAWDQAVHGTTGCMSQYSVTPTASNSSLDIGTTAKDTWFPGAVGKVAIYDSLLSYAQINAHYAAMTDVQPVVSCSDTCTIPVPTP